MLRLSKKADYALIALRHLAARRDESACSAREIARAYHIPTELLAKVLQKLVKSGLLQSQHGAEGGYALAREACSLTAYDVVRAIDGPLFITSCYTARGECSQAPGCTVRAPLTRVNDVVARALSSVTIESLNMGDQGLVQLRG